MASAPAAASSPQRRRILLRDPAGVALVDYSPEGGEEKILLLLLGGVRVGMRAHFLSAGGQAAPASLLSHLQSPPPPQRPSLQPPKAVRAAGRNANGNANGREEARPPSFPATSGGSAGGGRTQPLSRLCPLLNLREEGLPPPLTN